MAFFTTGKGLPLGKGDIINSSGVSVPGNPIENRDGMFVVKWDRVTPHGKGILADHEQFPPWSWDVPTMAVWDTTALTDVIVYQNTGEFQYDKRETLGAPPEDYQLQKLVAQARANPTWPEVAALTEKIEKMMHTHNG